MMIMSDSWLDRMRSILEHDEGKRDRPYDDATGQPIEAPKGNVTIGIGRNLDANPLSDSVIAHMLNEDISVALLGAAAAFGKQFLEFSEPRQHAIISLIFQLGITKFMDFENTIAAMKAGDWVKAVHHLESSKWHRQVTARARRVLTMIEHEKYPYPGME
jgi:GH24 family phage-related lysozyme (muramidase)